MSPPPYEHPGRIVALGLVMILVAVPSVVAQDGMPGAVLAFDVEDNVGDTSTIPGGVTTGTGIDILRFHGWTSPTLLKFGLETSGETTGLDSMDASLAIRFSIGDAEYEIEFLQADCEGPRLSVLEADLERFTDCVDGDWSGGIGTATVPMQVLTTGAGAAVVAGDIVEDVEAFYVEHTGDDLSAGAGFYDAVPNSGAVPDYQIEGQPPAGQAFSIQIQQPVRNSNGEAGTFIFVAGIHNKGPTASYRLAFEDVPPTWSIVAPPSITVEEGSLVQIPIIVDVQFRHEHGAASLATLVVADGADAATAQFGINYLSTPQPSGHHPTVYFHSRPVDRGVPFNSVLPGAVWMNGLQEDLDPAASDEPAPASYMEGRNTEDIAHWIVRLSPKLVLGLDFEANGTAHLEGQMGTFGPVQGGSIAARLRLETRCRESCLPPVYLANATMEIDNKGAGESFDFALDLAMAPGIGRIPFEPGQNLMLDLMLGSLAQQSGGGADQRPKLIVGETTLTLPLREYHDELGDQFGNNVDLQTRGEVPVLSLSTDGFGGAKLEVESTVDDSTRWRFVVAGAGAENMTISPQPLALAKAGVGTVEILTQGWRPAGDAPVYVLAYEEDGRALPSLFSFDVEVADDPAFVGKAEETAPGPDLVTLGVLLVLGAWSSRRR